MGPAPAIRDAPVPGLMDPVWRTSVLSVVAATGFVVLPAIAQPGDQSAEARPDQAGTEAQVAAEEADLPEYGGDWRASEHLSGDWGGVRTRLAEAGLTFDVGWTQFAQGVVAGGRRRDWDYGGNVDVLLEADFEGLGLWSGGSLSARAESRYGETVNDDSGAFTPVNTRGYFPFAGSINEGIPLTITELSYTQSVSDSLEFTVGKMLTAEGDPTEFAGGGGRSQFLNSNFIYNAATSQTAPYSTLGAALDWSPAEWLTLSGALFGTADASTTSGFSTLNEGLTWWMQAETRYRIGGLPGGMNAGAQYAFGNEFVKLGGKLILGPEGLSTETVSDSWAIFWGAWQYLYTADTPPDEIDAWDADADLRGVGLFARVGFADPDANPVNWSGSLGVGGRGMIPGRADDTFGVGYYYTDLQTPWDFSPVAWPTSSQGFEAYYKIAFTAAVDLTFDVQWIDEGFTDLDPATVVGFRLDVEF